METKRIFTESPEDEQWRLLMHYTYPINIKDFLKNNGNSNPSEKLVESISSSLLQAKEYFQASKLSTLQISPLLMYYGTTNLLYGIANLITGRENKIENHGMYIQIDDPYIKIADISIYPNNPKTGALSVFCNIFCSTCKIINSGKWKIKELFASIPDLLNDFLDCYKEGKPYVIPVQILKQSNSTIERIKPLYLERLEDFNDVFDRIEEFENNYLTPQYTSQRKYIILHPKMGSKNIGIYSISGQKFLKLSYLKNGNLYDPSLEIIMFMALYALGFISRYHPEIWNPFIRNDISGEKLLIEKFLYYSRRFLPNLALNYIMNNRIVFVNETQGFIDNSLYMTKNEVKSIVEEEFRKMMDRERMDLR